MMETQGQKSDPNSTDASIGKSLRIRVETRKAELKAAIAKPSTDKRVRGELEIALGELDGLLGGDLDHIPKVVAAELSTWLEANKHIDEHHPSMPAPIAKEADEQVCCTVGDTKPEPS